VTQPQQAGPDQLAFQQYRTLLFSVGYRILGTAADAEDVVQDAWFKWSAADRSQVADPKAYLTRIVSNLSMERLRSTRHQRETYVGPWLPEPVDTTADPYLGAERGEALELAVLMLMERLSPTERAAYVLREAFDYPYPQIAEILGSSEPAVRQLVSRARKRVAGERRNPVSEAAQRELLSTFLQAARAGDLETLERLFAADVSSVSDGNGAPRIARRAVVGADRVARYIAAFGAWFWDGLEVSFVSTNGRATAVLRRDGAVFGALTIGASAAGIEHILWVMNPDKLAGFIT
jgi:RNA polymerase sigma-70 factor (TIGR02957 family)